MLGARNGFSFLVRSVFITQGDTPLSGEMEGAEGNPAVGLVELETGDDLVILLAVEYGVMILAGVRGPISLFIFSLVEKYLVFSIGYGCDPIHFLFSFSPIFFVGTSDGVAIMIVFSFLIPTLMGSVIVVGIGLIGLE